MYTTKWSVTVASEKKKTSFFEKHFIKKHKLLKMQMNFPFFIISFLNRISQMFWIFTAKLFSLTAPLDLFHTKVKLFYNFDIECFVKLNSNI